MIFISYWELNPDFDPSEMASLAQNLISKKLYPVEGVKQIAWYVSPDYWGVTIEEADTEEQLAQGTNVWRMAKPGMFKMIKTASAMEATKVLPLMMKLKKKLES